jgi:hypothetical protein
MKRLTGLIVVGIALQQVFACCMLPRSYKGSISQNTQEAVIFHHNGMQDMILRINYEIKGEKAPDQFAWIITVPNEPQQYELADSEIYEETFDWAWPLVEPPRPRSNFLGLVDSAPAATGGLELSQKVEVGPYDIQPIKVKGADALGALNEWLTANGFPTEDPGHMKSTLSTTVSLFCASRSIRPKASPRSGPAATWSRCT